MPKSMLSPTATVVVRLKDNPAVLPLTIALCHRKVAFFLMYSLAPDPQAVSRSEALPVMLIEPAFGAFPLLIASEELPGCPPLAHSNKYVSLPCQSPPPTNVIGVPEPYR